MMRFAIVALLGLLGAWPAAARACPLVVNGGSPCDDGGGISFETPLAMCLDWVVIDGGEAFSFGPCDGSTLSGSGGDGGFEVGFALAIDGAQLGGAASTPTHTTTAPVIAVRRHGRVIIARDWRGGGDLYAWRKEFTAGKAKPRNVALQSTADKTARAALTGCAPTSWNLQAGANDTLLEVVELTCDRGAAHAIRQLLDARKPRP